MNMKIGKNFVLKSYSKGVIKMNILDSERLVIHPWQDTDLPVFEAMNADPKVMAHMPNLMSKEDVAAMVMRIKAHFDEHGYGLFSLERKDNGEYIGYTGLCHVPFEADFTPAVEVGWRLLHEAWGHGYVTEAASRILSYAFEDLQLDEVVSFTVQDNTRSWAVMERIGMIRDHDGDFMHPRLPVDHPLAPHILYRKRASL